MCVLINPVDMRSILRMGSYMSMAIIIFNNKKNILTMFSYSLLHVSSVLTLDMKGGDTHELLQN